MKGKEWFENSNYINEIEEYDEGGFLGINEDKIGEMLDAYHQYKLKLIGLHVERQHREQLLAFAEYLYEGRDKDVEVRVVDNYLNTKQLKQ